MLVLKENPIGLEARIQQLQEHLYRELGRRWPTARYDSYGLCLPQRRNDGKIYPEVYAGGGEFKDVFWNDRLDALSFFGHTEYSKDHTHQQATVHLVFMVNQRGLKPSYDRHSSDLIREDVRQVIGHVMYGFHLRGTDIGLRKSFREYAGITRSESTKNLDVYPMHCFRLNFSIVYKPDFQTLLKL